MTWPVSFALQAGFVVCVVLSAWIVAWKETERREVQRGDVCDREISFLNGIAEGEARYAKKNTAELETIRKAQETLLRVQREGYPRRGRPTEDVGPGVRASVAAN